VSLAPDGTSAGLEAWIGTSDYFAYLPIGLVVSYVIMTILWNLGFASLVLLVKGASTMVDTSSFLIQGLTGTQNPPRVFPRFLVAIALAIPITHFIDLLRVETLGITPLVGTDVQLVVFLASSVVFPIVGVVAFRRVERRSRIRGDLHVH